ncbi:MAG: hypothetical protein E3J87_03460 [Candidatus Cloacimonadota bacterium]|nr:MAG: hypothetical protein E3J87_03460 [Candidatus Cloacimonadota bacterium]
MELPPYEPQQVPEGHYRFKVMAEPEKTKRTSSGGNDFVSIKFSFKLMDELGNIRYHKESLVPWNPCYRDLLLAFGAKPDKKGNVHLGDEVSVVGKEFDAEIIHEPDKDDPKKSWSRIANIKLDDDVPPPKEDDEVPF